MSAPETQSNAPWIVDFVDGSREMRELLGGKGAGVAEMTRVLGAERVPAGFTITTAACAAYMDGGAGLPDGRNAVPVGPIVIASGARTNAMRSAREATQRS